MHVHLIGVCGTGMGSLAGLLCRTGQRVTGSDVAFHPPMSDALARWGVETRPGWDPTNLDPAPDLVVIGNVCRRDNPEARAAIDGGMRYASFPAVMEEMFLAHRRSFVVAGSHGKTTTTSMLAHLLYETGADPGFLVGGMPRDFDESFRLGHEEGPFVIEGDEYDSAFFEKTPKFWRYRPSVAVLTSIEHDHIDIYPDAGAYLDAFRGLVRRVPPDGLLVAWAGSPTIRDAAREASCRVTYYALEGEDTGDATPVWLGAPAGGSGEAQAFDLFVGGSSCGRVFCPLTGRHNVLNAIAAIAAAAEGAGAAASDLTNALARFGGVRRRQELLGVADGVRVYDDFAHHPTEVRETLRGLRRRHATGRLIAAFEPRSATACRRIHQDAYPEALSAADVAVIAPVGRPEVPVSQRLDVERVVAEVRERGGRAEAPADLDGLVDVVLREARPGDAVVLMSNGPFGGVHDRILAGLGARRVRSALDGERPAR